MFTQDFQNDHIYNFSENVSEFLQEYLEESINTIPLTESAITNPKITFFEQRIAALEGGVAALSVKSFNKAKYSVIRSLLKTGDSIVTFNSYSLYHKDRAKLNRYGIEVKLSEDGTLATFKNLIDSTTKLIYLESISEEYLNIPDFQKIVAIAKQHSIPVLVDNTSGSAGYLTRPIAHGANIVIERTKNWLPSHKELIGAVIIDGGNYNWQNGKFSQFDSTSLHLLGNIETKRNLTFSIINFIKQEGNINYSAYQIPQDPLSLIHDLEKLPSIIQNQNDNAAKLALWLIGINEIADVNYTGLPSNASYFTALTFFRKGFGTHVSFKLKNSSSTKGFIHELTQESSIIKDYIRIVSDEIIFTVPDISIEFIKAELILALQVIKILEYPSLADFYLTGSFAEVI
jgi:O-acetylhomoserine/O-acetylserine sulfhydrylase-like pyridoxal-dependent enzyme